jgi:hypothetical protein
MVPPQSLDEEEISAFAARSDLPSLRRWATIAEKRAKANTPRELRVFDVDNPYAVEQWSKSWGLEDSEYLTLDGSELSRLVVEGGCRTRNVLFTRCRPVLRDN